jgi:hypothetical protein
MRAAAELTAIEKNITAEKEIEIERRRRIATNKTNETKV